MSLQRVMIRTLLGQNIAVLLITTLFALVLSLTLLVIFVIRPEAQRAANVTVGLTEALAVLADGMEGPERVKTLQLFNSHPHFSVKVSSDAPKGSVQPQTFSARFFLRELKAQYSGGELKDWRIGEDGWLWVQLTASDPPLWISFRTAPVRDPVKAFIGVFTVALLSSLIGGVFLQRHLARPLKELEEGIDSTESGTNLPEFNEAGPREISAIARALNQMSETMQMAEMDRAVMLAGVSHDLRTPLTKLRLSLAMLQGADQDLLISAERQVSRIEAMLAQFLEYARGFSEEQMQTVNLKSLLHEAVAISSVDTAIKIDCPANMHVVLKQGAVIRAISNLVTNADSHGAPPIEITARRSNERLAIEVSDAGSGISPDNAGLLTRPFARGNTARTNEGAGLGLAIANQVVLEHGGTLSFERPDGRFCAILSFPK
tara:strand:- start:286 stop:1581 length:1296 start_codon:yes stop_codon:yes gene_type:complete